MALVMVLLVLALTLAFFYLKCSMMQSLMLLWASVVSTILTFSFYESVAGLLISRGYGLQWAHVGVYVLIFIVAFAVLRSVSELLIGINIDLGNAVKVSAAVSCGLLTGIIFSGNLLVAMGLLPLQGKVFYSRFDPSEPVILSSPKTPALGTDGFVSGLYGLISSGSMSSNKSFNVLHADYLTQIHLNKLKTKDGILTVCSPEAIKVPSKKGQQPVRFWTSPDNEKFIVVRMGISAKKVSDGGAGNAFGKIEFFPAQIRLIVREEDKTPAQENKRFTGSAKALYPVGFLNNGTLIRADLKETISPDLKDLKDRMLWQDVVFGMSQGDRPVLLGFKQDAVVDLSSYTVVESTPEIENALNAADQPEEAPAN
jgi:hypothetical protein